MKCPECKTKNADKNQFCDACGASLAQSSHNPSSKKAKKLAKKSLLDFALSKDFKRKYKIIEQISRDKMGTVYKAEDKKWNKTVALRIIDPKLSAEPWVFIVERLKEKSLLAKESNAEKLKKLYDIGTVGKLKFISMEYAEWESLKPPKKLILSLSTALIILIGLVIYFAVIKIKPEPPPLMGPGKKSIAVMYFENNTGDESLDHWRKAFSDLLITDLSQSRYIRVLSEEKLFNILQQLNHNEAQEYALEVLQQVAEKGQVGYFLLGSYSKAGNQFRINIKIQAAKTGELLGSETVKGEGEESIFPMVDDLTRRIKATFEFPEEVIANDIDKDVGKITTSSPEAYKYYSQGKRYFIKGNYRQSIPYMEKAIAIDPQFAMAYSSISTSYYNMGYKAENKKYMQKALALTDRISDRERFLIQGMTYLQSEKTLDKAVEAYKKLLQLYPDDLLANYNLGAAYGVLEQFDKASEKFEVIIQSNEESILPYVAQSFSYMCQGSYDKAIETLEYYLSNFSDNENIRGYLAYNYLCQRKYELALVEADKAISLNSDYFMNFLALGDIYHMRGDLIEAEKEYQKLLKLEEPIAHLGARTRLGALCLLQGKFDKAESLFKQGIQEAKEIGEKEWEADFHIFLAYLYIKSGNPEKSLEECNKAWDTAAEREFLIVQRYALHHKAFSFLEMNSVDKAAKTAEELKKLIEQGPNKKYIRCYHHLLGMIELKRKNFSQAIEYFKKALSLLPFQNLEKEIRHNRHALFIESLASAYFQAGELEKAREEYEKITFLTMGRLIYGDIYTRGYYMLGKIYQQKNQKGKAIENYETFLNLWKDADPGIPEITDAKKQLEILQSN